MEDKYECMVPVLCTTYNQKKYISTCLDSLVNQKTTFPYEIIVRDDASTDGTSDIVREYCKRYPEKIVPLILEENYFQRGLSNLSFEKMFRMSKGKYIALCEGDDFWTDENKLQKQVDFMEEHPDYSICGHASYFATESGMFLNNRFFRLNSGSKDLSVEEILSNWVLSTSSMFYRKSCQQDITIPFQGTCINGDIALMTYLALKGKVYYLDELMSAYRMSSNGSISQKANSDPDFFKNLRLEYIAMLDRIDAYTQGQYSDTIKKRKDITLFDMYMSLCDSRNLKKYRHVAKTLGYKLKIRYILCAYLPPLYRFIFRR